MNQKLELKSEDPLCRHLGKFKINKNWIHDRPELAMNIFKDMIIINCQYNYNNEYEYIAMGRMFSAIKECVEIPAYQIVVENNGKVRFDN